MTKHTSTPIEGYRPASNELPGDSTPPGHEAGAVVVEGDPYNGIGIVTKEGLKFMMEARDYGVDVSRPNGSFVHVSMDGNDVQAQPPGAALPSLSPENEFTWLQYQEAGVEALMHEASECKDFRSQERYRIQLVSIRAELSTKYWRELNAQRESATDVTKETGRYKWFLDQQRVRDSAAIQTETDEVDEHDPLPGVSAEYLKKWLLDNPSALNRIASEINASVADVYREPCGRCGRMVDEMQLEASETDYGNICSSCRHYISTLSWGEIDRKIDLTVGDGTAE